MTLYHLQNPEIYKKFQNSEDPHSVGLKKLVHFGRSNNEKKNFIITYYEFERVNMFSKYYLRDTINLETTNRLSYKTELIRLTRVC